MIASEWGKWNLSVIGWAKLLVHAGLSISEGTEYSVYSHRKGSGVYTEQYRKRHPLSGSSAVLIREVTENVQTGLS